MIDTHIHNTYTYMGVVAFGVITQNVSVSDSYQVQRKPISNTIIEIGPMLNLITMNLFGTNHIHIYIS
jgi:hypothetical protein